MQRILVVETDSKAIDLIKEYLPRQGYQVEVAASGADALASIRADIPSVLITGEHTPGMEGADLVSRIRADASIAQLPVIVLHTRWNGDFEHMNRYQAGEEFREGCQIFKPFNPAEVIAFVRRCASNTASNST